MLRRNIQSVQAKPRGVAGNILWSTASRGVQAVTGFAVTVAVTRHLSLADLGEYLAALAVAGAIMSVGYCGIQQYLVREIGRKNDEAGALVGAGVLIRLAIIALAGLGLAGWAALASKPRAELAVVAVALGAEAFRSMGQLAGAVFQAHEHLRPECFLSFLYSLLWGTLLTAAIVLDYGALGLMAAGCLALAGHGLASWIVVVRGYVCPKLAAGRRLVGPMLRISLVIGLSVILVQNLFRVNVLALQWLGTTEDVAFFQTPHELVLRSQVLFQAVMLAAFPTLSRLFVIDMREGVNQGMDLAVALGRLVSLAACGLALTFALFAGPFLGTLYGTKLLPAAPCLKVLALGTVPLALGMLVSQVLIATGGQSQVLVVNVAALALNMALSLTLIPRYGVLGASLAALVSYAASALGLLWAARGTLGGRIAELANARALIAMLGGTGVACVFPDGWSGPAGLGAFVILLAALHGSVVRDIRVLVRCVRPVAARPPRRHGHQPD